jgi:hypothetical protein
MIDMPERFPEEQQCRMLKFSEDLPFNLFKRLLNMREGGEKDVLQ